jgi:molecular chaperone DnaJ
MNDPYQILGLSRNSNSDDIQNAYRKLAKQYHPDRNIGVLDAEKKFRDVQEAYDILNDPRKKSHFDQFGFSGPNNEWSHGFSQTMHDIFGRSTFKGRNIQSKVDVTLEEIAAGCSKTISVTKSKICNTCSGSGSKSIQTCNKCNGSGLQFVKIEPNFNLQTQCATCTGSGKISAESCDVCSGSGFSKEQESAEIQINIAAGAVDGMMKFSGQGEPCREKRGSAGDLIILVNVLKHEIFQRHDNHIIIEIPCTYPQLYKGFEVEVPTVYKEKIVAKIPSGTYPNSQIRIAGKGLPGGKSVLGDMFIIPKLDVPRNMPQEYEDIVAKLTEFEEKHVSKRRQDWIEKTKKYL